MHDSAMNDAICFAERYLSPDDELKIGDVGSYDVNGNLRGVFSREKWDYTGLDLAAGPNVDVVVQPDWLNVPLSAFDVIVSVSTLEHVAKPWDWMRHVARRLKRNGLIYINAPNTWGYHEYPIDCWRIWPDGMKALFDEGGITPIELYTNGPDTTGVGRRVE